jgi:hypothetical protein
MKSRPAVSQVMITILVSCDVFASMCMQAIEGVCISLSMFKPLSIDTQFK